MPSKVSHSIASISVLEKVPKTLAEIKTYQAIRQYYSYQRCGSHAYP
ncbi:MAG: hypothetical protein PHF37_04570 [Phycisphaerae bacterium]|nr:hypothetical protein [Phycisphaerae bacterium]